MLTNIIVDVVINGNVVLWFGRHHCIVLWLLIIIIAKPGFSCYWQSSWDVDLVFELSQKHNINVFDFRQPLFEKIILWRESYALLMGFSKVVLLLVMELVDSCLKKLHFSLCVLFLINWAWAFRNNTVKLFFGGLIKIITGGEQTTVFFEANLKILWAFVTVWVEPWMCIYKLAQLLSLMFLTKRWFLPITISQYSSFELLRAFTSTKMDYFLVLAHSENGIIYILWKYWIIRGKYPE